MNRPLFALAAVMMAAAPVACAQMPLRIDRGCNPHACEPCCHDCAPEFDPAGNDAADQR